MLLSPPFDKILRGVVLNSLGDYVLHEPAFVVLDNE